MSPNLQAQLKNKKSAHIVIVGGGFAGLKLLKSLKNTPFKVTLIDKNNFHTFQPLLYQVATASLSADSIGYPFRRTIGAYSNFSFLMAEVENIDTKNNRVETSKGNVEYDLLVLAMGSVTNFFGNTQVEKLAMQLKSISQALDIRSVFLQEFERAVRLTDKKNPEKVKRALNFVIVGGGPTGVEVAGALAEIKNNILKKEYKEIDASMMQITLIDSGDRVLRAMSEVSSHRAERYLKNMGVKVLTHTLVESYNGECVKLKGGVEISTSTVIWSAGVKGNLIKGLNTDCYLPNGRVRVDEYNLIKGHENIAALGDIAQMETPKNPRGHPMMAQVAIQEADNLSKNLIGLSKGKTLKKFVYKNKGSMATIGRNRAVAEIGKIKLGGWLAWYVWMIIHVVSIIGFRNRIIVLFNWAVKYFSSANTIRLIVRPYSRKL